MQDHERWYAEGTGILARFDAHGDLGDLGKAIMLLSQATDASSQSSPEHPRYLAALGHAHAKRYERTKARADIDAAVDEFRVAAGLVPTGAPGRHLFEFSLGLALITRFEAGGRPTDLDDAIAANRAGVAASPAGYEILYAKRVHLAQMLATRSGLRQMPADLDEALTLYRDAVGDMPVDHAHAAPVLDALIRVARTRFFAAHSDQALEDFIEILEQARLTPAADGLSEPVRTWLGAAFWIRYDRSGELADLRRALEEFQAAMAPHWPEKSPIGSLAVLSANLECELLTRFTASTATHAEARLVLDHLTALPAVDLARVTTMPQLAFTMLHRYLGSSDRAFLDLALKAARLELSVPAGPGERRSRAWSVLGQILLDCYDATADPCHLHEAIGAHEQAAQVAPEQGLMRSVSQFALAEALRLRHEATGSTGDLTAALGISRDAVRAWPADSGAPHAALQVLSTCLTHRFWRYGQPADIDEAISIARQVTQDRPDAVALRQLASALIARFQMTGRSDALEEMVAAASKSAAMAAGGSPMRLPGYQHTHAMALLSRFDACGDPHDIGEAIAILRQIIPHGPPTGPDQARYLGGLAQALLGRFATLGSRPDLDEAITMFGRALTTPLMDAADRLRNLSGLATALHARYQRDQAIEDLNQEIELLTRAKATMPDRHAFTTMIESNLGVAYRHRHRHSSEPGDLAAAVAAHQRACDATPAGYPDRARALTNLSLALYSLFAVTADPADIGRAVIAAQEAASIATPRSPARAQHFSALGMCLQARYEQTGEPSDLDDALLSYQVSMTALASPAAQRMVSARQRGDLAAVCGEHDAALASYAVAIELLPRLAWRGLAREDQEHQLTGIATAAGLTADAAAAATAAGRLDIAVQFVEHGRSVLWAQMLELRTDLSRLREAAPDLASELDSVHRRLDSYSPAGALSPLGHAADQDKMTLAREWDTLLARVRQVDGFGGFLQPPSADTLRQAAGPGPVVILNAAQARCDALVISAGRISAIPLPFLSATRAWQRAGALLDALASWESSSDPTGQAELDQILFSTAAWLWDTTVQPVLQHLEISAPSPPGADGVRLWWCPTGPLTFLPIHAAGHYDGSGRTAPDMITSSYTPTLSALAAAKERHQPLAALGPLLLTAVPQTAQASTPLLLGTLGEQTAILSTLASAKAPIAVTVRTGSQATTDIVRRQLTAHSLVHFACHAYQNLLTPSASGLQLYDGMLTIADLTRLNIADGQLACLAACSTGAGAVKLPDESISLAAAMHLVGYQHVIATMWSARDTTTRKMMARLYHGLLTPGGLNPGNAARALAIATRQLRDRTPGQPSQWMTYFHIGP